MTKSKKLTFALVLLAAFCVSAWFLFSSCYMVVGGEIVSRETTEVVLRGEKLPDAARLQKLERLENLDLRNIYVQPEEYEQLRQQLPDCHILWNVPFQGGYWENTVSEVTVSSLNGEEMALLQYFPNLETVDARGCRDYDALMELRAQCPELTVMYTVDVGDCELRENTTECTVTDENAKNLLALLRYLPELRTVNSEECTDYATLMAIRESRPEMVLNYTVTIGGVPYAGDSTEITLENADGQEAMELLQYLPSLTTVAFTGTVPDNETMYQLKSRYQDVVMQWDFELFGVQTNSTATELILNEIPMESTETVEEALKYFYNLERVEMCQCGIPSEDMDALWKRHPETRFVWAIPMGCGFVRTDVKAFIPFKYGYNIDLPFYDTQAKELKYLVDLECLDLGHMRMTDISFLQYMPKLRFLILADVVCEDFSYLADLTDLVYLELFRSYFDDVELLMNLKKLEDLNIGWTDLKNPELLAEMTWLKRLWTNMNGMTRKELAELKAAMPDTYVYIDSAHPTEGGWRQSYLYYEMRDMLGMFYMK